MGTSIVELNKNLAVTYGILGAVLLISIVSYLLFFYLFKKILKRIKANDLIELEKMATIIDDLKQISSDVRRTMELSHEILVTSRITRQNKLKPRKGVNIDET
ncbi:hypothetical protein [Metamycoplasma buccale]|uniref:hypothetical protein n=1 Tax=Metamycoplasma buccale TaxID=55602 RepID=UPI00398E6BB4